MKLLTNLIHKLNHTNFNRSAVVSKYNLDGQSIIELIPNDENKYHLSIGVYQIQIDEDYYIFHLYISTLKNSEYLIIESPIKAYVKTRTKIIPIALYKVEKQESSSNIVQLENTINNYIDLMIISSYPCEKNSNQYNINDLLFTVGDEISLDNEENIIDNLGFIEESNSVIDTENYDELIRRNINNVNDKDLSYSNLLRLQSSNNEDTDTYKVELKVSLKNLANNIHDTAIINADKQIYQIIKRISRKIFTGRENWQFISKNDKSVLFFIEINDMKKEISNESTVNNIRCSCFDIINYDDLIKDDYEESGICTSYNEDDQGIYVRISTDNIDITNPIESFNKWIMNNIFNKNPFIIDYEINEYLYKTYLIDEYHIKTYYPTTKIENSNAYDISYCYKSFKFKR